MIDRPLIFVAFGITGDLMRHKILPCLFALYSKGEVPELTRIVGISRQPWNTLQLQEYVAGVITDALPSLSEVPQSFLNLFYFQKGDVYGTENSVAFEQALHLDTPCNTLFYLAIAPDLYEPTLQQLSQLNVFQEKNTTSWVRIIVEKPFGHNLESAASLNARMHELFPEENVYRADHYLQKALSREVVTFRRSHPDVEAIWNKEHIASIRIRLWETVGVERRAAFYDQTGALRDVGQNHVLQLLGLVIMEHLTGDSSSALQKDRAEVLQKLVTPGRFATDTLRAQYIKYGEDTGIPSSETETYFAVRATIGSDQWSGVPIELDAGKYMPHVEKYIEIQFIHSESILVSGTAIHTKAIQFQLGNEEKILLIPEIGTPVCVWSPTKMHTEYENIVLDVIHGERTFFVSIEEVLASWRFIDPIIESWNTNVPPLQTYKKGEVPSLLG